MIWFLHLLWPALHRWQPGIAFCVGKGRILARMPVLRCHCGAIRAKG